MKKLILYLFLCNICAIFACRREPSPYHSRVGRISGDNGFKIKIQDEPEKYTPGRVYTLYLLGSRTFNKIQHFKRFILSVESSNDPSNVSPQSVGTFQLFGDSLSKFNEDCVNTVSETYDLPKTEVYFMWTAPPAGSGCVTFRAMVLEDANHWYADDGQLSKTFCEKTIKDEKFNPDDCCACDEAKYRLVFEGIWSNTTHPKDFPFSLWLTHFSDVIGASHEKNFSFWGDNHIATDGFRSLAEWGSVSAMETELRAKSKYLRTIIKAAGLWYPNVNTNATTSFKVDRRHHLVSLASMFGPSPDWVVGVNGLSLCLKNCTWVEDLIVDLYPWDAGTDSGITYMSPNSETNPREKMYRITTTYPEDPRAPFYDPTKKELPVPMAKFYFHREKLVKKSCDESFLASQLDVSEDNAEDTAKRECDVSEYGPWSECSVTCGKGLRMRTREYRMPQKAQMFGCSRQLISKEMCVAAVPECEGEQAPESAEEPLEDTEGLCAAKPWSEWSECSADCGAGFIMRTRLFRNPMGRKKCPHVSTVEKEKCMGPPCTPDQVEVPDPMCPVTEWSDWSPCSVSCGKGMKLRTRLILVQPDLQLKCSMRVKTAQQKECSVRKDCTMDMQTAKRVCMEESEPGPCTGSFQRWYFEPRKQMCVPFAYGGCRGNRNNFVTQEECTEACRVVRDAAFGQGPLAASGFGFSGNVPVDCMVTEWTDWSQCSVSCGSGLTLKYREIKVPAQNGGIPCPNRLTRRKKCFLRPCH